MGMVRFTVYALDFAHSANSKTPGATKLLERWRWPSSYEAWPRERKSSWSLTPLDLLLLAVPIAIALRYVPAWRNETLLFVVAAIAIVPLAGWMGRATEQLAARSGSGIGGFLNATFGNAAELIIGLVALSKGLTGVVKASITGSIIGNLLLVLGASILVGGHPPSETNL